MLNIKKVAYGLKDVTTLVAQDQSFQHPELEEPIEVCLTTQPEQNKTNDTVSSSNFSENELSDLAAVVRKILTQMNA